MDPGMDTTTVPACPVCGTGLALGSSGELDSWRCPNGHGLAMTLSEAHGRLQDDEVADLWQRARVAPAGPLPSPFGGPPMVRVELPVDPDEAPEGEAGDGPTTATVTLDVDLDQQFIWFDAGELDELPEDLPNAGPTPEQLEAEERIRRQFGEGIEAAAEERESTELSERLYRRAARHPGMLSALDSVGRAVTSY